ncbi:hypothetical protein [Niabella ginsengisoli]|uniref:Phosphoprotein n=1 Tax=Niabella ginsengisoli TaxID=522298 RepID=A0ABS9SL73_9BACT|nr:hypothetical protein [Niabella ginsengisoli]MCH5599087.1 hypothetical protein [Niabella ginsengisoli]
MERIGSLIEKLSLQFSKKAPLEQLLSTAQLLQNEIAGSLKEVNVLGTSGISVIVPNAKPLSGVSAFKESEKEESAEKEYFELIVEGGVEDETTTDVKNEIPSYEELMKLQNELKKSNKPQAVLSFKDESEDGSEEMPTLSRQGKSGTKAAKQSSAPKVSRNAIKDLHKAISAQDRIVFVSELFRGDEIMFERSIKTINNFTSLTQAEYWIRRELRTKNGWLASNLAVQQFEQLIQRRFA